MTNQKCLLYLLVKYCLIQNSTKKSVQKQKLYNVLLQMVTTLTKHRQKRKNLQQLQAVLVVHVVLHLKRKLNLLQLVVHAVELLQHKTLHLRKLLPVAHVYFVRANA